MSALARTFIFLLFLGMTGISVSSCNDDDKNKNPLADSLRNVNIELPGRVNEKEEALQEFIASFNEIQENPNTIKDKEKIVSSLASQGDVRSRQNQIREDIQAIYDL